MEATWTEERVRALFQQLRRAYPQVPRWSGAALGTELRRIDSTFHKNVLGDITLKRLVLRLGDLGRWIDEGVGVFEWSDPAAGIVLHREWWLAASRAPTEPDQWFDLETLKIERAQVADHPERYLLIPALDDETVRSLAEQIGDHRTVTQLREEAQVRGDASLSARRFRMLLTARVAQWATEHGIALHTIGRFTAESRQSRVTGPARAAPQEGSHPLAAYVPSLLPEEARGLVRQIALLVDGDARPLLAAMLNHVEHSKLDNLSIPARLLREKR